MYDVQDTQCKDGGEINKTHSYLHNNKFYVRL